MAKLVYTDPSGRELSVPLGPDAPVVSIGRATDCTIRSNRKSVSRRHAEFRYNNGDYQIVDLNSSNGTYIIIDDRRKPVVEPESLAHYDEVWCGDFILRFHEEGSDTAVAPAEAQSFTPDDFDSGPAQDNLSPPDSGPATPAPVSNGMSRGTGPIDPIPYEEQSPQGQAVDNAELERLRDEKQSIQELADRQARDIDDLQGRLEQTRSDLQDQKDVVHQQSMRLEDLQAELNEARTAADDTEKVEEIRRDLEAVQKEKSRLEEELTLARQVSLDAEDEQQRADDAEQRLRDATAKIDDLRQHLDQAEQKAHQKTQQVDDLREELDRSRLKLEKSKQNSSREQLATLREEVARQERLLGEFEKRNRDLQLDLQDQTESGQTLTSDLAEAREHLQTLRAEHDEIIAEREELLASHEKVVKDNKENAAARQQLEEETENLRNEIEGLKQRLRLEKKRARKSGAEETQDLQNRIDELTTQLDAAQAGQTNGEASLATAPKSFVELAKFARTLDRVIDAIERTDLSSLSTVDRVRLQSAIRETQPRQTLSAILEIVSDEDKETVDA